MKTAETIRRVPWTCSWGRFGEPAPYPWPPRVPRLVFWTCAHPSGSHCPLTRHCCEECVDWEQATTVRQTGTI
jgi:hypothetical protein